MIELDVTEYIESLIPELKLDAWQAKMLRSAFNADLICRMRNALPTLLAERDELRAENEKLVQELWGACSESADAEVDRDRYKSAVDAVRAECAEADGAWKPFGEEPWINTRDVYAALDKHLSEPSGGTR